MNRLTPVDPAAATGKAKELLEAVRSKFNSYPALFRIAAQSPQGLEAMLGLFGSLGAGALSPKLQEQVALAVSEQNGCEYCLSAHTAIGRKHGLPQSELDSARDGRSEDPKSQAALQFVGQVLTRNGHVSDEELAAVRSQGWSDGEIVELIGHVALTTFTNFLNNVAQTKNDFTPVRPRADAVAV